MTNPSKLLAIVTTLVFCATPITIRAADAGFSGKENSGSNDLRVSSPSVTPLAVAADSNESSDPQATGEVKEPKNWHLAIYPAWAWAPIFGASVTEPPPPSSPPGAPSESGDTSTSLNGALFVGGRLEINKWDAEANLLWAGLSAKRENPLVKVNMDFIFGQAMAGHEVLSNLYLEGGVRRLALSIDATVESLPTLHRQPGFWDPLVGLTYRRHLSKKWTVFLHGDGGGFGVGSDVDVTATARAEWQFARHFGLTFGYGGLHFSKSDTVAGSTLKISPTLHGPIFGFGIYF